MEMGDYERLLKSIRVSMLEPGLLREITELADELGYETAIKSSSSLHFLLRLYRAEQAKEKRSAKALKKAEDIILRLQGLQHPVVQRENARRTEERRKRFPLKLIEGGLSVSRKSRESLNSIGIEDEGVIIRADEMFGEKTIEERVGLVKASTLDLALLKKVFGTHPDIILIPHEDDLVAELDAIEGKKMVIDIWSTQAGKDLPVWADYNKTPGILVDTYEDISRQLSIPVPDQAFSKEKKGAKYRGRPMDPSDFMKVVEELGFVAVRQATHGTMMKDGKGGIMCIQKAHRSQMVLQPATIKKKLAEAGVDLDEFEKKRREFKL